MKVYAPIATNKLEVVMIGRHIGGEMCRVMDTHGEYPIVLLDRSECKAYNGFYHWRISRRGDDATYTVVIWRDGRKLIGKLEEGGEYAVFKAKDFWIKDLKNAYHQQVMSLGEIVPDPEWEPMEDGSVYKYTRECTMISGDDGKLLNGRIVFENGYSYVYVSDSMTPSEKMRWEIEIGDIIKSYNNW